MKILKRIVYLIAFLVLKPRALFSIAKICKIRTHTMQTIARVYQMEDHIRTLDAIGVTGAVVETGCWKGGLGAYMAQFNRETWLFDSFEGLPELDERDSDIARSKGLRFGERTGYLKISEDDPKYIARLLGVDPHIIKGWFSNTLPMWKDRIGPIAVLRLDGDTYGSTKDALDTLYDQVVSGGIVVVDDYYDFDGCRKALEDFFLSLEIKPKLKKYPFGRVYFEKS